MKTVYFPLFTTAQWIRTTHFYPADALMPFVVCVSASGSLIKQLWSCVGNCITVFCRYFTVSHYKCPLCDMTCPSPSALRNHIKFRHSNEKPYSCDCCEYRCYSLCSILYQRKRLPLSYPFHHSVFFFFFIPRCKNLIDLRKHLDTHSSEPTFHCDIPGCTFTSRALSTMKLHHKREHEVKRRIK